jgi:hypothetical protein
MSTAAVLLTILAIGTIIVALYFVQDHFGTIKFWRS